MHESAVSAQLVASGGLQIDFWKNNSTSRCSVRLTPCEVPVGTSPVGAVPSRLLDAASWATQGCAPLFRSATTFLRSGSLLPRRALAAGIRRSTCTVPRRPAFRRGSAPTAGSAPTRRAASIAQSTRLLLSNDLIATVVRRCDCSSFVGYFFWKSKFCPRAASRPGRAAELCSGLAASRQLRSA